MTLWNSPPTTPVPNVPPGSIQPWLSAILRGCCPEWLFGWEQRLHPLRTQGKNTPLRPGGRRPHCFWTACWLGIQKQRLTKTWLVPWPGVIMTLMTASRHHSLRTSWNHRPIREKKSRAHLMISVSRRKPALRRLSKIAWPSGPARCGSK